MGKYSFVVSLFVIANVLCLNIYAHSLYPKAIVNITEKGFIPEIVKIKAGTTVVWVNQDSGQHWPASDLHPTHTRYPGSGIDKCGTFEERKILDSCDGLLANESFQFHFDEPGEWGIHDHINPIFTMNVEVSGNSIEQDNTKETNDYNLFRSLILVFDDFISKFKSSNSLDHGGSLILDDESLKEASNIKKSCETENSGNCYSEQFKILVGKKGLIFAQETLFKLWDLDPATRRCHLLAHAISETATRLHPEKWKEYVNEVNYNVCSAGLLHGIFEAHIGDDPNFKLDSGKINELCLSDGEYYKRQNCVHYMGHLLMVEHSGNVNASLDACEGINEGLTKRCYTGVFMEDSFPLGLVGHSMRDSLPDRRNIHFVNKQRDRCLKFSGDKAVACWIDMGENLVVFYSNPNKTYDACNQAKDRLASQECYLKAAVLFAIHPAFSTKEQLISVCEPFRQNETLYGACTGRMVSALLYYSPKFFERGKIICSNIEDRFKDGCYKNLANIINVNIKSISEREGFCRQLPDAYANTCMGYGRTNEKPEAVIISDMGFSKLEITIEKGTTVIWMAQGEKLYWPASDYHPTHGQYPEGGGCIGSKLDACRGLKAGETFSFKFEKIGTFTIHDHLFHGNEMTIHVVGDISSKKGQEPAKKIQNTPNFSGNSSVVARKLLDYCSTQNSKELCLKDQFSALSQKNNFTITLKIFRDVVSISQDVTVCHQIAHEISRTFVQKDPDKWKQFLANAPPDCNYGFTHGAVEGYARLYGNEINITPEFIHDVCINAFDKSKSQIAQCVHVFGHMLLVSEKGDTPKGLSLCLTLKDFYSDQCFHGVFMENLVKFNLASEGLTNANMNGPIRDRFSLKDVEALCNPENNFPTNLCWQEMSHAFLFISNYDPTISFQNCSQKAPTESAANSCIRHALLNIIAQNEGNPQLTKPACFVKTNISGFLNWCFITTAQQAIYTTGNRKKAVDFCNDAPENIQPACFKSIGNALRYLNLSRAEGAAICSKAPLPFQELCTGINQEKSVTIGRNNSLSSAI